MNINRLREAEAMHARLLEDVKEVNRKHKVDYDELVKVRKVRWSMIAQQIEEDCEIFSEEAHHVP